MKLNRKKDQRLIIRDTYHNVIVKIIFHVDRIGMYSFALTPFDYQPTGTCNFNRLTNKDIKLTLANNTRSTVTNKPISSR